MEWTNSTTLQFLAELKKEPCLWDPGHQNYKQHGHRQDAWRRIENSLPFKPSVDDMKKKKDVLFTYYKAQLKKYIASNTDGNVYTPNWFAFNTMHEFLGPIYSDNNNLEEPPSPMPASHTSNTTPAQNTPQNPNNKKIDAMKSLNNQFAGMTVDNENTARNSVDRNDDVDHFAAMIAAKLKTINDPCERGKLMSDICKLVYQ